MAMGRPRFDPRQQQRGFQIRVNHRIRVPEVRVIDANGDMLGVLQTHEALTRAQDELYVCFPLIESDRARQTVLHRPSRFITEVPKALLEIWSVDEEDPLLALDGLDDLDDLDTPKLIN